MDDGKGVISSVVHDVTQGLKQSPSCLAAIVLAAVFALLTYFSLTAERQEAHERTMAIISKCMAPKATPPLAE